jgi:hypothetical protein
MKNFINKTIEVLKRIIRNPATKVVAFGLVAYLFEYPQLIQIAKANPLLAIFIVVIVGLGLYIDPKTPGITDNEKTFYKEILDVLKLLLSFFVKKQGVDLDIPIEQESVQEDKQEKDSKDNEIPEYDVNLGDEE